MEWARLKPDTSPTASKHAIINAKAETYLRNNVIFNSAANKGGCLKLLAMITISIIITVSNYSTTHFVRLILISGASLLLDVAILFLLYQLRTGIREDSKFIPLQEKLRCEK